MRADAQNLMAGLVACALVSCSPARGAENDASPGKAAALGAEANFSGIRTFKCRFTLTKASAATISDALKGNYTNARKCEFLLVVDGEKQKLESRTPIDTTLPKNLKEGTNPLSGQKGSYRTLDFAPLAGIRRGDTILRYVAEWKQAQIFEDPNKEDDEGATPLSELQWRPANGLKAWRELTEKGGAKAMSQGVIKEDGRTVVHLQYEIGSRTKWFVFDPQRGNLPLKFRSIDNDPKGIRVSEFQSHLLAAQDVGKGRWFPTHVLAFTVPTDPARPFAVADYHVSELVVDKVSDEDLSLEIGAGTTIFRRDMPIGSKERMTLRKDERISPDDIPRIEKMLKDAPYEPLMDTAIPHPSRRWYKRWYFVLGSVVTLVAGFCLYRRWRFAGK
jgi:hypothetical protein